MTDAADIHIKQYEIAENRLRFYAETKTKFVGFFFGLLAIIVTIGFQKGFSAQFALFISVVTFGLIAAYDYLNQEVLLARYLLQISEDALNRHLAGAAGVPSQCRATLCSDSVALRRENGKRTFAEHYIGILVYLAFLMLFLGSLAQGASALVAGRPGQIAVVVVGFLIVLLLGAIANTRNKSRKRRFRELCEHRSAQCAPGQETKPGATPAGTGD